MDNTFNQERRSSKRSALSIPTIVKGQESDDFFWKENTVLLTVSRTGASFNLQREGTIGRLISVIIPMPTELRAYDFETEFYRVWGVIQHCTAISNENFTGYHIGVAFIGKYAPESFGKNPLTSYRMSGLDENGLWKIFEAKKAFVVRQYPRFDFKLVVKLTLLDSGGNIVGEENTSTLNISRRGAAVISGLKLMVADQIIFTCAEYNFSSKTIVCNQQKINKSASTLHLEFIENEFPTRDLFPLLKNVGTEFEIVTSD